MKKIFLFSFMALSLTACQEQSKSKNASDQPSAQHSITFDEISEYEEAKATLDELFLQGERLKKEKFQKKNMTL